MRTNFRLGDDTKADASAIGLAPHEWPEVLRIRIDESTVQEFLREGGPIYGEVARVTYRTASGRTLTIEND